VTPRNMNRTGSEAWVVILTALLLFQQPLSTSVIVVDGGCSLADAITAANTDSAVGGCSAGAGADELQLTGDVTLTTALPAVTSDVTVEGNDFSVTRDVSSPDFGIFSVVNSPFALRNTTVSNGKAVDGGAIYAFDNATIEVSHSTLTRNAAEQRGGAIHLESFSDLMLLGSTISDNYSGWDGGGISIYKDSGMTMVESQLVANTSNDGGALYNGSDAYTTLQRSTISGNSGTRGGFVYNGFYARLTVTNSTVSGNTADQGGGVYNAIGYGDVYLINSTVAGNSGANLYSAFESGFIAMSESIIAYPLGGTINCAGEPYFVDLGNNFDDDATCPGTSPITPGVDFDTTLADNGGPTQTHALLPGSVAIDAAGACGLATDQRGVARDDGACDSGSFELDATGVGGSVSEIRARAVRCRNVTTTQAITFDVTGETSWNCEAQGLAVSPGDAVRQLVSGRAVSGAGGAVTGVTPSAVRCRNVTTGQTVPVALDDDSWDCVAEGLVVSPGDRVEQEVGGTVP